MTRQRFEPGPTLSMSPIEIPSADRDHIPTDPLSPVELEALLRLAAAEEGERFGPPRRETVELPPVSGRIRRGTRRSREILRVQDIRPDDPANDADD